MRLFGRRLFGAAISHERRLQPRTLLFVVLGGLACMLAVVLGQGFTVDDALISARVAYNLSIGAGYRFNLTGPITDSVTPLGWAHLLSAFAGSDVWSTWQSARIIGVLCAALTGLQLGFLLSKNGSFWQLLLLLPIALSLPVGAWSQSGMETPWVMLLLTTVLLLLETAGPGWALLPATVAAAMRPELIPWTFTLGILLPSATPGRRLLRVLLALSGPVLVALIRLLVFDRAAPLAIFAKPADSLQGLNYVLAGIVLTGLPLMCLGFRSWLRVDRNVTAVGLACMAEWAALVAAGGDWMALFRLFVPILPCCVWLAGKLSRTVPEGNAESRQLYPCVVRSFLACLPCIWVLHTQLLPSRSVVANRRAAVDDLTPMLQGARNVGTVDVGWVGAATDANLVDFAGATDEAVAYLPGSHTSKRLPKNFLLQRHVDALVLLLAPSALDDTISPNSWQSLPFARVVEQRIARMPGAGRFRVAGAIPFGKRSSRFSNEPYVYLVLRRTRAFARPTPCFIKSWPPRAQGNMLDVL